MHRYLQTKSTAGTKACLASLSSLLLAIFVTQAIYWWSARKLKGISCSEHVCGMLDLPPYLGLVNGFWFSKISDPYTIEANRQIFRELLTIESTSGMPYGISPTSLLILLPAALLSHYDMDFACKVWNSAGLLCLLLSLFYLFFRILGERLSIPHQHLTAALCLLAIVSTPAGNAASLLGQTSIFACPALVALTVKKRRYSFLLEAGILLVLSVKPTSLMVGVSILLCRREFRGLTYGAILICLACAVISIFAAPSIWLSYIRTMTSFANPDLNTWYRPAFSLDIMTLSRPALTPLLGTSTAHFLTSLGVAGCLVVGCFRFIRPRVCYSMLPALMAMALIWLFSPYLGLYEDVLLIAIPAVVTCNSSLRPTSLVPLVTCIALALAMPAIQMQQAFFWAFIFKVAAFVAAGALIIRSERESITAGLMGTQ